MKRHRPSRAVRLVLLWAMLLGGGPASRGEGPLYVGGPPQYVPGVPFRWTINPLTYWTDQGTLGTQTNSQADDLVAQAFGVWQTLPTASISFSKEGKLPKDVVDTVTSPATQAAYLTVMNQLNACTTPIDPNNATFVTRDRSIIYDTDGSIIDAVFGPGSSDLVLGFADALCFSSDGVNNSFNRGFAVLNGKPVSSGDATLTDLKAVMIHEFGHMIGLDHSQVNLNCLTSKCAPGSADLEGVPIMFPVQLPGRGAALSTDDVAGVSALYPETVSNPPSQVPFASTTGRITGRVLFSDGLSAAQGYNVIARQVGNPRAIAVSNVSGYLFTADAGNPLIQQPGLTPSPYGSRDSTLIGSYDIPGLPPASYTVEVEAIDRSFVIGSGVGPIGTGVGFQFPLPSLLPQPPACTLEFLVSGASASCTDKTTLQVDAGQILASGTDVILLGTPPRYDAWEDGP